MAVMLCEKALDFAGAGVDVDVGYGVGVNSITVVRHMCDGALQLDFAVAGFGNSLNVLNRSLVET